MRFFYCYESAGWFSPEYNEVIPADAVEVDQDERQALFAGIETGLIVVKGQGGRPELAERPGPSDEQLKARERVWRDAQLVKTDPLVMRHRDELEMGVATTLSTEHYGQLLTYRNELRKWPELQRFPTTDNRPQNPGWLK
nr:MULTISPECIES: phage tail protein [unclassified Pseudomonas]